MEFKIDMSKVAKVIVNKDEDNYMEYNIEDGTITDVRIFPKNPDLMDNLNKAITAIEKEGKEFDLIDSLKESIDKIKKLIDDKVITKTKETKEFKKVDDIMRLVKDGSIDKLVKRRETSLFNKEAQDIAKELEENEDKVVTFDDIKENIEKDPLDYGIIDDMKTARAESAVDSVKEGAKAIMELDKNGTLDAIAAENREKISEAIFGDKKEKKEPENTLADAAKINDREERIKFLKDIMSRTVKKKDTLMK